MSFASKISKGKTQIKMSGDILDAYFKPLFDLQSEEEMVCEQKLFIEQLTDITSYYVNA